MFNCCDPFLSSLTLNLLTTTIVAPPSNASKWQMGFNSAFKGLSRFICYNSFHQLQCHTAWYPKFSMLHVDILRTVRCRTVRKAHKISQNKLHR